MDTNEFIKRSKMVHGDKYDYSKSIYVNPKTNITVVCRKHGEFSTRPYNHMNGAGCRKCADEANSMKYRKGVEEFTSNARKVHGDKYDYSKVKYVNWKTKVCITCPEHGDFWQTPNAHLSGQGCPKCGVLSRSNARSMSTEEFIEKAKKVHGDKYDYSKVYYSRTDKDVLIKCNKCGTEFYQTPENHLQNKGCPKCANHLSKAEEEIYNYLCMILPDEEIVKRDRNILNGKELDILIPSRRIAVEYCGLRWHSEEFNKDKNYHINKLNECNENGISLVTIFEDEWLSNKDIVLLKLRHIVNCNDKKKIFARKTSIQEITKTDAECFLNVNHIQGFVVSSVYLGCFYNDRLVAVMTFKKTGNNWELNRFASDNNLLCVGVAGKLFSFFVNHYNPNMVNN